MVSGLLQLGHAQSSLRQTYGVPELALARPSEHGQSRAGGERKAEAYSWQHAAIDAKAWH